MNTTQIMDTFVEVINQDRRIKGDDPLLANAYTLGYASSFFGMIIDALPKAQREEILAKFIDRTEDYQARIKAAKAVA